MAGVTVVYGLFLMGSDHPEHTHEDPEEIQAAARGERTADQTATTITSKADRNRWVEWGDTGIPAPTVAGDPRLPKRKYRRDGERQMDGAVKMELWEAAVLQSFPADFPFQGKKGKQFLQVGNAVPPLMAEAILRTFLN